MNIPVAVSLATSTAARVAAVDALALLAAIVVAFSVVGLLVAWVVFDPSVPRPYRLAVAPSRSTSSPERQDVPYAA